MNPVHSNTRQVIFDQIRANPGTYRKDLSQRLGLPWGTISYHIRVLKRQGLIDEKTTRGKSILWPHGFSSEKASLAASMRRPGASGVFFALKSGSTGIHDLSVRLDLSRKVVRRILDEFVSNGILEREPGLHGRFRLAESNAPWVNDIASAVEAPIHANLAPGGMTGLR